MADAFELIAKLRADTTRLRNAESNPSLVARYDEVLATIDQAERELNLLEGPHWVPPPSCQIIETYRGYHIVKKVGYRPCMIHDLTGAWVGTATSGHEVARKLIDDRIVQDSALSCNNEDNRATGGTMKTGSRYSVEKQVDGTYAVFNNGGFVKGNFYDRTAALHYARDRADEDEQVGVPIAARAE